VPRVRRLELRGQRGRDAPTRSSRSPSARVPACLEALGAVRPVPRSGRRATDDASSSARRLVFPQRREQFEPALAQAERRAHSSVSGQPRIDRDLQYTVIGEVGGLQTPDTHKRKPSSPGVGHEICEDAADRRARRRAEHDPGRHGCTLSNPAETEASLSRDTHTKDLKETAAHETGRAFRGIEGAPRLRPGPIYEPMRRLHLYSVYKGREESPSSTVDVPGKGGVIQVFLRPTQRRRHPPLLLPAARSPCQGAARQGLPRRFEASRSRFLQARLLRQG